MTYKEFYELLNRNRMVSFVWEPVLEMIETELANNTAADKEDLMKLFAIYFSLIDDGNTCMSLDENILTRKWNAKVDSTQVLMEDSKNYVAADFDAIRNESQACIKDSLGNINDTNLPEVIGKKRIFEKRIFEIEDKWLYVMKYNVARKGILNSLQRLFSTALTNTSGFSYSAIVNSGFVLSKGQERAVNEGLNKNLLITGGPGTGKTTSILFILLNLLSASKDYEIYLVAPSGKASSRMKESIINGLPNITSSYVSAHQDIIDIIKNLEESTIHRLLGLNHESGGFNYNRNHRFTKKSIFIIDEASMIDVCLFNALLQAIPDDARIFIMGDKNQLPSVESGAAFGEMLKMPMLAGNIIELDESKRFGEDTKIYELADAINTGKPLPVKESDWQDYTGFAIQADDSSKPIFYYKDEKEEVKDADIITSIASKWANEYYKDLQKRATELDENDLSAMDSLFDSTEKGRILCAENDSARGVHTINRLIKEACIDDTAPTSVIGQYPGQLMMVTRNNKALDLYNGDSGILVSFKGDATLYFMVKKSSLSITQEGKKNDDIFKIGEYIFYPLRMITRSDIDLSYAITIHKSQGSDYRNILVILPKKKGHPLLNRQIIYTAITRTKGNTYILSNQERLNEAKDNLIIRDTNII